MKLKQTHSRSNRTMELFKQRDSQSAISDLPSIVTLLKLYVKWQQIWKFCQILKSARAYQFRVKVRFNLYGVCQCWPKPFRGPKQNLIWGPPPTTCAWQLLTQINWIINSFIHSFMTLFHVFNIFWKTKKIRFFWWPGGPKQLLS